MVLSCGASWSLWGPSTRSMPGAPQCDTPEMPPDVAQCPGWGAVTSIENRHPTGSSQGTLTKKAFPPCLSRYVLLGNLARERQRGGQPGLGPALSEYAEGRLRFSETGLINAPTC